MITFLKTIFVWTCILAGCCFIYATIAWQVSPVFREKIYIAGLLSEVSELQKLSAKELRDFPSKRAAISLLTFLNFKAPGVGKTAQIREVEDKIQNIESAIAGTTDPPEGVVELHAEKLQLVRTLRELETEQLKFRELNNRLANKALWSLAFLSGESFGTDYEPIDSPYSWRTINPKEWPAIILEVNSWATSAFAEDALGWLAGMRSKESEDTEPTFEITVQP